MTNLKKPSFSNFEKVPERSTFDVMEHREEMAVRTVANRKTSLRRAQPRFA